MCSIALSPLSVSSHLPSGSCCTSECSFIVVVNIAETLFAKFAALVWTPACLRASAISAVDMGRESFKRSRIAQRTLIFAYIMLGVRRGDEAGRGEAVFGSMRLARVRILVCSSFSLACSGAICC